jgi:hypothetical protein
MCIILCFLEKVSLPLVYRLQAGSKVFEVSRSNNKEELGAVEKYVNVKYMPYVNIFKY